jgi:hypothetical protein
MPSIMGANVSVISADEMSLMLKRRMNRAVFILIILVANFALALAANVIIRLVAAQYFADNFDPA